jgi:hypothetical protein
MLKGDTRTVRNAPYCRFFGILDPCKARERGGGDNIRMKLELMSVEILLRWALRIVLMLSTAVNVFGSSLANGGGAAATPLTTLFQLFRHQHGQSTWR